MKTCLVVDDSDVVRKVARRILETMGFTVSEADSGQTALEACQARMPNAILLDWHMPPTNGIEVVSQLRKLDDGSTPLVFYCTSENDAVDISRALAAGADDYILKPFDRSDIAAKFGSVAAA